MKPIHYFIPLILAAMLSCGPQTETRVHMDETGNRMSDSLERMIDSSLAAPAQELWGTDSPITSGASRSAAIQASK